MSAVPRPRPGNVFGDLPLAKRLRLLEQAWYDEIEVEEDIREMARTVLGDWVDGDEWSVPEKAGIVAELVRRIKAAATAAEVEK